MNRSASKVQFLSHSHGHLQLLLAILPAAHAWFLEVYPSGSFRSFLRGHPLFVAKSWTRVVAFRTTRSGCWCWLRLGTIGWNGQAVIGGSRSSPGRRCFRGQRGTVRVRILVRWVRDSLVIPTQTPIDIRFLDYRNRTPDASKVESFDSRTGACSSTLVSFRFGYRFPRAPVISYPAPTTQDWSISWVSQITTSNAFPSGSLMVNSDSRRGFGFTRGFDCHSDRTGKALLVRHIIPCEHHIL